MVKHLPSTDPQNFKRDALFRQAVTVLLAKRSALRSNNVHTE